MHSIYHTYQKYEACSPYYITHARTFERAYLGARIYIIRYTSKTRSFKSLQVLKEH